MRDYGKVHTSFWSSSDIRSLSEDGRTLAQYLLTSPHGTIAGVFALPDGYAAEDLQWSSERVREGFAELLANGFANRCETTKWVWICKYLEWNQPENPNQRKSAAQVAHRIPAKCLWKQAFIDAYGVLLNLSNRNRSETVAKPLANQEQEQEQDRGTGRTPPTPPSGEDEDFETQAEQVARLRPEDQELFWLWKRRQQRLAIRYHAEGAYTDTELARQLHLLDYEHPRAPIGVDHRLAESRLGEDRFRPIWSEERNRVTYLRSPEDAPDGFLPRDPWDERVEARLATN